MAASNKTKRPAPNSENFLEALRGLRNDMFSDVKTQVRQAVTSDISEAFGLTPSGELRPQESISLSQMQPEQKTDTQMEMRIRANLAELTRQQEAFTTRQQAEIRSQIEAIKQEVVAFVKTAGEFTQELQVATMQLPAAPGKYHRNFFIHLRQVISSLRQKVESSRNWLAAANARSNKRGYYWGQVKSSGTKYMLSGERYMVMSTG